MSLIACPIAETAKHHPDSIAITTRHEVLSYQALHRRICAYQMGLRQWGATPVALYASSSIESIACLWAMLREGIPVFLPHLRYSTKALIPYFENSHVRNLLHESTASFLDEATDPWQQRTLQDIRLPSRQTDTWLCLEQISTYLMTSGSSGKPKIATHTLSQHLYSALGVNTHLTFGPTDQWLLSLPLYHVSGLGIVFRCFFAGATLLIPTAGISLRHSISALQPSHLSLVPHQLKQLEHIDSLTKQRIRAIILGGSGCPETLLKQVTKKGFPVLKSYGMTEMSATITCNHQPTTSSGKIMPYRELAITEDGEIAVRGKSLFSGYLENNYLSLPLTYDGWFLTGDMGYLAEDQLYVTGRKDGMILSGGENIHPEEIEEVLLSIPEVQRVAVIGISDPEFGQRPVAFVDPILPQATFINALEAQLPRYKWPVRFFGFPDTFGGKPSKHVLREWLEGGDAR